MKALANITGLPVAAAGIATGKWLYLVYVIGVLYALFGWRQRWLSIPIAPPTLARRASPSDLHSLRWSRAVLIPAAIAIVLLTGDAYVDVFTTGKALAEAITLTLAAFALVGAALMAHKRVKRFDHE